MAAAILRRLARLMIQFGVSYQTFNRLARLAYVHVARKEMDATLSRSAAITGMDRKYIRRLEQEQLPEAEESPLLRVMSTWRIDMRFQDEEGHPLDLSLNPSERGFRQLVRERGGDVRPASVLAELIRLGVVEKVPGNRVRLVRKHIASKRDLEDVNSISRALTNLIETIHHNLNSELEDRYLQQQIFSTASLDPEKVEQALSDLRKVGLEAKSAANQVINRAELPGEEGDANDRVLFGVYVNYRRLK